MYLKLLELCIKIALNVSGNFFKKLINFAIGLDIAQECLVNV